MLSNIVVCYIYVGKRLITFNVFSKSTYFETALVFLDRDVKGK
jgi:hypothetical protein